VAARAPPRAIGAVALAALWLPSCSSGSDGPPPAASAPGQPTGALAPTTSPSPRPCPRVSTSPAAWPDEVPADLPKPPNAAIDVVSRREDGVTIVRFSTPFSLREGVLFVVSKLPKAGYTIGRGDAEANEADAPFERGAVRGVLRMVVREPCTTDWLLAVARTTPNGSPVLPTYTATSVPSPLPFG